MESTNQIYKCSKCNHLLEVINVGQGELSCCGDTMELLTAKDQDDGQEKHVPVIEKTETGYKVKIGSVPHPMEEKHFIQWIEFMADGLIYRQNLQPGQVPEAEFCVKSAEQVNAREYCNLHGLWQA